MQSTSPSLSYVPSRQIHYPDYSISSILLDFSEHCRQFVDSIPLHLRQEK